MDSFQYFLLDPLQETPNFLSSDNSDLQNFYTKVKQSDLKYLLNMPIIEKSNLLYCFIIRSILSISDQIKNESKNNLIDKFITIFFEKYNDHNALSLFLSAINTLLALFFKENFLGKSYLFEDSEKKLNRSRKEQLKTPIKPMQIYDFSEFSEIIEKIPDLNLNDYTLRKIKTKEYMSSSNEIIKKLSLDGEIFLEIVKYTSLFYVLKEILSFLDKKFNNIALIILWRARLSYIHNLFLDYNPVSSLKSEVLLFYKNFISKLEELKYPSKLLSIYNIEYIHSLLFYYKYELAESLIIKIENNIQTIFKLTGKLGVRTKYQTEKTAQLVLETSKKQSNSQENINEEPENEIILPSSKEILESALPKIVDLDSESILYETPLIQNLEEKPSGSLNVIEQLLLLAKIALIRKSLPEDELRREQISAYLDKFLEKSENWLVFSTGLYLRSVNEFTHYKKKERSLLQLEELIRQYNTDPENNLYLRGKFLFSTGYPSIYGLQKTLAEKYMQMGCVLSSCELFEKLSMQEECVECLAFAGHTQKAKDLADTLIKNNKETPKLYCILADISNDITFYKKAWKLSEKKFARAQRSLARYYFDKKMIEKSKKSFEKALELNPYHPNSWFTLGCIHLSLNDCIKAIRCFSSVVQIDESQGEAWGNLAASFAKINKKKQSISALEQGLKHCENNWRMWQNMMYFSLEIKLFGKFLESVERLINLGKKDCIDNEVLKKITQIMKYHLEGESKKNTLEFYHMRINGIFKLCAEKLGEKWEVWENYAEFTSIQINFIEKMNKFKNINNKIDENPGKKVVFFVENENEEEKLLQKQKDIYLQVYNYRKNACQCLMTVNWEKDLGLCEKLEIRAQKLIDSFKNLPKNTDKTEINLFLETISNKLQSGLDNFKGFELL